MSQIREPLAALAHEQWAGWMRYMFFRCVWNDDRGMLIPRELADKWHRQVETPYAELSEAEKDSDRKEADRMLAILYRLTLDVSRLVDEVCREFQRAEHNENLLFAATLKLEAKQLLVAALREGLEQYGQHKPECAVTLWGQMSVMTQPEPTCTCGFADLLVGL